MEILDEIVLIFGDDDITFEKYAQTLKIAFSENNLGAILFVLLFLLVFLEYYFRLKTGIVFLLFV